jgi:hypothetical protein
MIDASSALSNQPAAAAVAGGGGGGGSGLGHPEAAGVAMTWYGSIYLGFSV